VISWSLGIGAIPWFIMSEVFNITCILTTSGRDFILFYFHVWCIRSKQFDGVLLVGRVSLVLVIISSHGLMSDCLCSTSMMLKVLKTTLKTHFIVGIIPPTQHGTQNYCFPYGYCFL
jgi:hypothetical protein